MNTKRSPLKGSGPPTSASNMLYHGQARNFEHACRLLLRNAREEHIEFPQHYPAAMGGDLDFEINAGLEALAYSVRACLVEYLACPAKARECIERWLVSSDLVVKMLGECLRDGDYRKLAI